MSAKDYDKACGGDAFGGTTMSQVFDFANSNNVEVGSFDMYFVLGAAKDSTNALYTTGTDGVTVYKLADCSVGSASIDFDIEGIAQIGWSGNGKTIEEAASLNTEASGSYSKRFNQRRSRHDFKLH